MFDWFTKKPEATAVPKRRTHTSRYNFLLRVSQKGLEESFRIRVETSCFNYLRPLRQKAEEALREVAEQAIDTGVFHFPIQPLTLEGSSFYDQVDVRFEENSLEDLRRDSFTCGVQDNARFTFTPAPDLGRCESGNHCPCYEGEVTDEKFGLPSREDCEGLAVSSKRCCSCHSFAPREDD
jgi:hypothetical protein